MVDQHVPLVDRLKVWWLNTLDSDSVRKWVTPYAFIWLSWAVLATFWLPPVYAMYEALGPFAYWVWVWAAIPANLAPIVGLKLRHGGSSVKDISTPLLFADWMGLILQATGHLVCFLLMVMFEVSAWISIFTYEGPRVYPGLTIFAAVMLLAWTGGTLVLFAQCLRKIQRGRELENAFSLERRLARERILERQRRNEAVE